MVTRFFFPFFLVCFFLSLREFNRRNRAPDKIRKIEESEFNGRPCSSLMVGFSGHLDGLLGRGSCQVSLSQGMVIAITDTHRQYVFA